MGSGRLVDSRPGVWTRTASPLGTAHWLQTEASALIPGPQWKTLAGAQETWGLLPPQVTSAVLSVQWVITRVGRGM